MTVVTGVAISCAFPIPSAWHLGSDKHFKGAVKIFPRPLDRHTPYGYNLGVGGMTIKEVLNESPFLRRENADYQ